MAAATTVISTAIVTATIGMRTMKLKLGEEAATTKQFIAREQDMAAGKTKYENLFAGRLGVGTSIANKMLDMHGFLCLIRSYNGN